MWRPPIITFLRTFLLLVFTVDLHAVNKNPLINLRLLAAIVPMTPIHVSTSIPLLYHSRHASKDSEIFFTTSTGIRSRDQIISVIRSYKPSVTAYLDVHYRAFYLARIVIIPLF